jgi:ADP-ribose pyrophosphatase YjhB (NUDIX family)
MSEPLPPGWLPKAEFDSIYRRVPRLTVEVVIAGERGVLLSLREIEPCIGLWHIPGGTVLFGEPVLAAVRRVAAHELGIEVTVGDMLGYIEYPSHYESGLDSPVGLAFTAEPTVALSDRPELSSQCRWFPHAPDQIHDEQREFLTEIGLWNG